MSKYKRLEVEKSKISSDLEKKGPEKTEKMEIIDTISFMYLMKLHIHLKIKKCSWKICVKL